MKSIFLIFCSLYFTSCMNNDKTYKLVNRLNNDFNKLELVEYCIDHGGLGEDCNQLALLSDTDSISLYSLKKNFIGADFSKYYWNEEGNVIVERDFINHFRSGLVIKNEFWDIKGVRIFLRDSRGDIGNKVIFKSDTLERNKLFTIFSYEKDSIIHCSIDTIGGVESKYGNVFIGNGRIEKKLDFEFVNDTLFILSKAKESVNNTLKFYVNKSFNYKLR